MFAPGVFVFFIVEPGDLGPTAGLAGLPGSLIVRLLEWQCGQRELRSQKIVGFWKIIYSIMPR